MGFQLLFFTIPICLYLARPVKNNYVLIAYLLFIFVFSYDNVTDYEFFFAQFREVQKFGFTRRGDLKELEWGWQILYSLMSFTKYGYVILHAIVNAIVIIYFIFESKKRRLLNVSILLLFLMNLLYMQDNMMRQNPAIILGFICVGIIVDNKNLLMRKKVVIVLLTTLACFFHFSAILLLVWFAIVYYMKETELNLKVIVPIVVVCSILRLTVVSTEFLKLISEALLLLSTDYSSYYYLYIQNQEIETIGTIKVLFIVLSVLPIAYFKIFNPQKYKLNPWLRLSVNMTVIVMVWNNFVPIHTLTRITAYMSWFAIWGFGYMINDALKSREVIRLAFSFFIVTIFGFSTLRSINGYFGNNFYMTVFTEDCKQLKTYPRSVDRDYGGLRLRHKQ